MIVEATQTHDTYEQYFQLGIIEPPCKSWQSPYPRMTAYMACYDPYMKPATGALGEVFPGVWVGHLQHE